MRTFTYRDKHFMYDSEALAMIQQKTKVDVFARVRSAIDLFIAEGVNFKRVQVVIEEGSAGAIEIEVKPV